MKILNYSASLCRFSLCLAMTLGFFQIISFAQQSAMWDQKTGDAVLSRGKRTVTPDKFLVYGLDRNALKQVLDQAPMEFTPAARLKEVVLEIPAPDGTLQRFRIEESQVLSPEIQAQFPDWKYYQGFGIDDPTATARFDVTVHGFRAQILSTRGTFLIDPFQTNDLGNYIVYYKTDVRKTGEFHCLVGDRENDKKPVAESFNDAPAFSHGSQIRVYRTAIAVTGEYTVLFGGQTQAFAQVTTTVNRVNGIYRKDLAVGLTLVSGTNLVYPDPATDPYTNAVSGAQLDANQTNINTVIGVANYDFGHLLTTAPDNGIAQLNAVCGSGKARGASSKPNPTGDPFDVDYVAHEMGHQIGGNHTFNATANCNQSPAAARMEAGSGVTIMGYAGICSSTSNLANHSIDNFHVYSQTEAINFVTNGGGAGCGTLTGGTPNAIPVIAPLTSYSIPFNTPFSLTAAATDGDGDALTYSWEQFDAGASPSSYPSSPDDDDTTLAARPLLRPYSPTANPSRMFPSLTYILNNANEAPLTFSGTSATGAQCNPGVTCITGEDLPSIARTMNFRVSVRDNRGGVSDAGLTVASVNTTTPFRITSANTPSNLVAGNQYTVLWDVSGTTAAPISTANVRILFSTDGGQTFPTVLAASTANDGSEAITVPAVQTTQGRIKIEAIGNIFFDINNANISVVQPGGPAVIDAGAVAITAESCGTPNGKPDPGETVTVTLPLSNNGGSATTNLTGTLQATGGVSNAVTQTYGAVAAGATTIRSFTFTVSSSVACGSNVVLTFVINDGATTYTPVTQTYTTGTPVVSLSENFDAVTAPALPAGWTSTQLSGTANNWVTTTTNPSSAPNAAFASDPASTNLVALTSPAVTIQSATAKIKFKNQFNTEDTYDGMVLEYSTNNGTTWTDVITGGGTFVSGGYTDALNTGFMNPLPGRQAWSGNSGGYIDTEVNLPASLNGQSVRFRWLMGSDSTIGVAAGGVWVDNVQVLGGVTCACSPSACRAQRRSDFNGDGKTDYAVFRPSTGTWFIQPNGGGAASGYNFGISSDTLQPADYDNDGKTDYAVYRSGVWYWTQSSDNAVRSFTFGTASDIPVVGDYTGDGKADLAVYRPSTGVWYIRDTDTGALTGQQWGGAASDVPVVGDFDGDCRMDLAVRRTTNVSGPGTTEFFILQSSNGTLTNVRWGTDQMATAIGDYDGDGKSDVGVVQTQGGLLYWYVIGLANNVIVNGIQFGVTGDSVTAGDYDGDGKTDLSVWRASTAAFYYRSVGNATQFGNQFGTGTDRPVTRFYQYTLP